MQGIHKNPEKYALGTWDADTLATLQMIPNYYLEYFYYTDKKRNAQLAWPPSRAEEVMQIEQELLAYYADNQHDTPPESLEKRGGAYYSTVATLLIKSHYQDAGEIHVVNTVNNGAVPTYPDEWVLELPSIIDRRGATPIPAEPLPIETLGLISAIKSYELLTVKAALTGDIVAARKALLAHPLGPSANRVNAVLDDLLQTNRVYLPQFEGKENE